MARRAGFSTGVGGAAQPPQAVTPPQGMGRGYNVRQHIDGMMLERINSPRYFTHFEKFLQRPFLNASLAPASADDAADGATAAELALMVSCNKNVELRTGGGADNAGVEALAGGGIRLETGGADGNNHIVQAHQDANQSSLNDIWDVTSRPLFMANLISGPEAADITNCILWAGWKLTFDPVTATDADQAFFRYENDVNGGRWQANTSIAGVDTTTDTGVLVTAATNYRLVVDVDAERVPRFYINDALVATGGALTAAADIEFFIGVEADGAAEAKELDIRNFLVSQLYG